MMRSTKRRFRDVATRSAIRNDAFNPLFLKDYFCFEQPLYALDRRAPPT
jgi:hypothetical protein